MPNLYIKKNNFHFDDTINQKYNRKLKINSNKS